MGFFIIYYIFVLAKT